MHFGGHRSWELFYIRTGAAGSEDCFGIKRSTSFKILLANSSQLQGDFMFQVPFDLYKFNDNLDAFHDSCCR